MDDWDALFDLAIEQHQAGELEPARALYRRILNANPGQVNARYLLGTVLLQLGEYSEAAAELEPLLRERQEIPDLHNNLGIAYHALERWDEAAGAFRKAIQLKRITSRRISTWQCCWRNGEISQGRSIITGRLRNWI